MGAYVGVSVGLPFRRLAHRSYYCRRPGAPSDINRSRLSN